MKRKHAPLLLLVLAALLAVSAAGQETRAVAQVVVPECSDTVDNDGDGKIDLEDPGCTDLLDETEAPDPPPPPACSDTVDNDGDGKVDAADPGCESASDDSEAPDPPPPPACSDAVDNDGDGRVDAADPGCSSASDDSEAPDPPPACDDNLDNDGDKVIDYPNDPGCADALDDTEAPNPQCSDGVDNDLDTDIDYPNDAGCSDRRDDSESGDPALPSQPTLTFDTDQYSYAVAGTVYANTAKIGQFTVDANAANATTVKFESPLGVVKTTTSPFETTYRLDRVELGDYTVTGYNSANRPGPSSHFAVVGDTAPPDPIAGFVNYRDGNVADVGGVIDVSWAPGADLGAGLRVGSGFLERQTVPLAGVVCDFSTATWVQVTQTDIAGSRTETLASKTCARYRYRISDNVGNETIYAPLFVARRDPSDIKPPGPVRNARITTGDHWVKLTYGLPFAPDFKRVKIYRWIAGKRLQTRGLLYTGTRTKKVDRGLFNGTRYVYQIVTCDVRDNCGLPGVLKWGTPKSRYLLTPRDGAVVTSPPRLTWRARTGALFYNVKLTRNGIVVLSRFPSGEALQLRWHWTYKGSTRRFTRGKYAWYVYPRLSGRYGALMGWSRFSKP